MKKILLIVLILAGLVFSQQNAPVKKDLRDFLLPVPNRIYQEYGYSEETLRLYSIGALIEMCLDYKTRIKVLETEVAVLREQVQAISELTNITHYDVNDSEYGTLFVPKRWDVDPNTGVKP